jgi:hypothetical protein
MRWKLLLILLMPVLLLAQYQRPGSGTAQFLDIGVSARAEAMAGAYISVAEGAESVFYNPAALAGIDATRLSFGYTKWFSDINHQFFAIAHTAGRGQALAFSMTGLQTDAMLVRTPLEPDGTGETFYAGSYRFGLTFAKELTDHVSFGMSANFIRMYLYRDFTENAYSGDIAVLYDVGVRNIRFGFGIYNFGSSVTFVNEPYPLPTSFSFGLSLNAIEAGSQKLLMSVAAKKPNDGAPTGTLGTEYNFQDFFFLRGGYYIEDEVKTFGLGLGTRIKLGGKWLQFDYSYNNFSALGGAQRFSLNFSL